MDVVNAEEARIAEAAGACCSYGFGARAFGYSAGWGSCAHVTSPKMICAPRAGDDSCWWLRCRIGHTGGGTQILQALCH